jgi:ribosomal protein uS19
VHARVRRRFQRGLKRRAATLMTKLRKAKTEAPPNEKPATVKTHLRDMIVVPEMIGSVVGIYNGKIFNTVEIKPEMTGHYLGEFSISYVWMPLCMMLTIRNLSSMVVRVLVLLTRHDLFR